MQNLDLTVSTIAGARRGARFFCAPWRFACRFAEYYIYAVKTFAFFMLVVTALPVLTGPASAREIASSGDVRFTMDMAAFKGREGKVLQEIYLRVPNGELVFREEDGRYEGSIRLSVVIRDIEGEAVVEDGEEILFTEDDPAVIASAVYGQTIIKRYHLPPDVYTLSVAVEDLEAPRGNLAAAMSKKNKIGVVRDFRVSLPDFPDDVASFSDAKFIWEISRVPGTEKYHPNPPRLYGLHNDTVSVYMELYLPAEVADSPTFEFRSTVVDGNAEIVGEAQIALPNPGGEGDVLRTYPVLIRHDVTQFPAGTYSLYVSFGLEGKQLSRVRAGAFSVAWDMRTWEIPRREYLAEARFLLGDEEYKSFKKKSVGEQENILDRMWKGCDPTPETGVNEAYEKFLVRMAYISAHYNDGGESAVFSPRGQLYMRYGPADELIQDFIPVNKETISEAVEILSDQYHPMNFSSHGGTKPYNRNATRDHIVDPRGVGRLNAGDNQGYPYELWVYNGRGDPILPRDEIQEMDVGMRYLFIDRDGYGRYILESSSTISTK